MNTTGTASRRTQDRGDRGGRGRARTATTLAVLLSAALAATTACGSDDDSGAEPVDPTVMYEMPGAGRKVAFTFDDGPNPPYTGQLLDVLAEHDVTAVFCLVGEQAEKHPELVRRIVEAGHVLCNHSLRHDDMLLWEADHVRQDIEATNELILEAVPDADIRYFRAPNGSWGDAAEVSAELGLWPLGAAVQIEDWEPATPEELVERLTVRIAEGSIVVMHDGGGDRGPTVAAVDRVIPQLRADGWSFVLPPHARPAADTP